MRKGPMTAASPLRDRPVPTIACTVTAIHTPPTIAVIAIVKAKIGPMYCLKLLMWGYVEVIYTNGLQIIVGL